MLKKKLIPLQLVAYFIKNRYRHLKQSIPVIEKHVHNFTNAVANQAVAANQRRAAVRAKPRRVQAHRHFKQNDGPQDNAFQQAADMAWLGATRS